MQRYDRHTLLDINCEGRMRIFNEAVAKGYGRDVCSKLLLLEAKKNPCCNIARDEKFIAIPGIVRREDTAPRPGEIAVGFTSENSGAMGRLRLAGFVLPGEVLRARTPVEVLQESIGSASFSRTPPLQALEAIINCGLHGTRVGVWGSAGLELATGYKYTHNLSDLDVLLQPQAVLSRELLEEWHARILAVESRFEIRIDAEIQLENGYGVSLKECCKKTKSILGKGITDVKLLSKDDIWGA
jgi:malonate decarboxylase holo-[acyl-carrier-protein] synthase